MKWLERILAALTPKRWPVRWRLAAVSATLTLIILVIFAVLVGRLTSHRLHSDFNDDLRKTAITIAGQTQVGTNPLTGEPFIHLRQGVPPLARDSALQIVNRNGEAIRPVSLPGVPDLGPPEVHTLRQIGDFSVVSYPLAATIQSPDPFFVQYARSTDNLDATINRLWLFLGGGVLGGTLLAALAGIAIAGRAMRPVSTLTATAREIASTRDPSLRIPEPETDDEVGELARTLDQMLRELDAARSETEQIMQRQREFVADASHELRTPLTSILANLELLQERLDETERRGEEGEMIDSALRSSRRMSHLVSDLLLLARADAGRTGPRRECDLATVAAAALSEVRPVANGHQLTLADHGPVPVNGNPDELHRLTVNLLEQRRAAYTRPAPRSASRSSDATATPLSRSPTTARGSRREWRVRSSRGSCAAPAPPMSPVMAAPGSGSRS